MAYNEYLAYRVRELFYETGVIFVEKKMMGGLCYMVADKMCLGISGDNLMVRLDPEIYENALKEEGCVPMEFTGRPMKGFVFVEPQGINTKIKLSYWFELALEYNPRAKSSKKKKSL